MPMFASRTPFQAGFTPRPYRFYSSGIAVEESVGTHTYFDPKNKWYGLQSNEANPVLAHLREMTSVEQAEIDWTVDSFTLWLNLEYNHETDAWVWEDLGFTPTEAHIEHAQKVLWRRQTLVIAPSSTDKLPSNGVFVE